MVRKFTYLTIIAFILAVFHACSLNNNILTPPCKIFEADLVDRWWYQEGAGVNSGIRFNSDGTCYKKASNDSMTYTLSACSKIEITNHATMQLQKLDIGKLLPTKATMIIDGRTVNYYPNAK